MDFYSRIADAYDELFPLNERQLLFVELALKGQFANKTVLDMGCGTGSLSIVMARRSAKVRAFDLDAEMIAKAEEKRPQALDLQFLVGDISEVASTYPKRTFDAVLCLGNTLAHMDDQQSVLKLFWDVSLLLKPGGKFIFQIVNYDQILKHKVDHLPTIETNTYKFVRNYLYRPNGKVDFNTILSSGHEVITENTIPLLPISKEWMQGPLNELFNEVEFNGGFDRSSWDENSYHTVVVATL